MVIVMGILVDKQGKTLGARINNNGKVINLDTLRLRENRKLLLLDNAIIDSNGFVRAKSGKPKLHRITINITPNTIENTEMQQVQKLLRTNPIIVYHGNKEQITVPMYGKGDKNNDYGSGFYTTPDADLGREWAMSLYTKGSIGYLHKYQIDITGLNILDFTKQDSLHWIAELLANRTINTEGREVLRDNIGKFISQYKLDTSDYDLIIGYRADDSYFTYATDFASGLIYKETLENALRHGHLGLQVFIKSKLAFSRMQEIGNPEVVGSKYRTRYENRKKLALDKYRDDKRNKNKARNKQTIYDFI